MSVHVMSWVLRNSPATLGQRLVLLVLADKAEHDGTNAWPAVATIAHEARMSERQVQRCLRELERAGAITRTGRHAVKGQRHGTYVYAVAMGAEMSPFGESKGDTDTPKGDIGHIQRVAEMSPDPSLEQPSLEPSMGDAVQRVYDHWREARDKSRSSYDRISPARRQKIVSRLREFPEPDLIAAIDAVAADPWHERARHDDLTVIFRSREQVDRFLEMAQRTSTPYERALGWVRTVGWEYNDEAIWDDLGKFGLTDEQRRELAAEAQRIQTERSAA